MAKTLASSRSWPAWRGGSGSTPASSYHGIGSTTSLQRKRRPQIERVCGRTRIQSRPGSGAQDRGMAPPSKTRAERVSRGWRQIWLSHCQETGNAMRGAAQEVDRDGESQAGNARVGKKSAKVPNLARATLLLTPRSGIGNEVPTIRLPERYSEVSANPESCSSTGRRWGIRTPDQRIKSGSWLVWTTLNQSLVTLAIAVPNVTHVTNIAKLRMRVTIAPHLRSSVLTLPRRAPKLVA